MKIAVSTNEIVSSLINLQAMPFNTLTNGQKAFIDGDTYVFYINASLGIKPDDLDSANSGRWINKPSKKAWYLVDNSYDFATNSATDVTSIYLWDKYQHLVGMDYGSVRNEITNIVNSTTFAALDATSKDLAAKWCASDDATLVTHYASTPSYGMLGDVSAATLYHLNNFGGHLKKMRDVAKNRINNKGLIIALMRYLKDRTQIDAFTDSIRDFQIDYETKFHIGTQYGDSRDGIMDYIESTGGYPETGLKSHEYNQSYIDAWIQANAVDPNNPTQQEQDDAKDYVRLLLVVELKDILIYGKV